MNSLPYKSRFLVVARPLLLSATLLIGGGCAIAPIVSPDQQDSTAFQFRLLDAGEAADANAADASAAVAMTVVESTATSTEAPTEAATLEPTETPTDVPTDTATPEPTDTPLPTNTATPAPTATVEPTNTPAPTEASTEASPAEADPEPATADGKRTVGDLLQNAPETAIDESESSEPEATNSDGASVVEEASANGTAGTVRRLGDLLNQGNGQSNAQDDAQADADTVDAEQRQFVTIVSNGRNINVRQEAGTEFGIVTSVSPDTVVEVLETSEDGNWLRISLDNRQGWIGVQFTRSTDPPEGIEPVAAGETTADAAVDTTVEPPAEEPLAETDVTVSTIPIAVTLPENMNVRSGPGTAYDVVAVAPTGTQYEILGLNPEGDWYQVRLPDQEEPGWVYVSLTETFGPIDEVPTLNEDEIPAPPEQPVAVAGPSVASPALVSAPPPSGAGFFGYGVQAHMLGGGIDAATNATQAIGFNWIKQQVEWRIFEGSPGALDFSELRRIVDSAGSRGISVLFSVVNAPDWAREGGFDGSVGGPPADPQTYANFVGRLAGDFCGSPLKAIEVWNEQNLHYEWGNKPLNPADYMNLLRPAYASIKSACPTMLVISGAPTPAGNNGNFAMDDFAYLEGMYQNGLASYSDGIGAHPSGYNVPPSVRHEGACEVIQQTGNFFNGACDNPHHSWSFRSTMEGYRNIMNVYGDSNKQIWPTEFGWAAGGAFNPNYGYANDNSYEEQAQWTVEAYGMMRNWGWVGPAFLWNLNFRVVADGTEKAQWGIVRNDYSPLPIYEALRSMPK